MMINSTNAPFAISSAYEATTKEITNINTLLIHSAVSPVDLENSSFRQIYFNPLTGTLTDYNSYYFPLDEVLYHQSLVPVWRKEYSFQETYQHDLSPSSMMELFSELQTNSTLLDLFKQYRVISSNPPDYETITSDQVLCGCAGLCNYLQSCMANAGIEFSRKDIPNLRPNSRRE
jgi:hypothetical protein